MSLLLARKAWEIVRKPEVCARPFYVQFEVTTHCNLACYMCVRNEVIKHPRHLGFSDFARVFDQIRAPKLTLSGAGEPLMNPELPRFIVHAREHGTSVMIPTNGTLLSRREVAEMLVETGLNLLKISIDAATPTTYQAIRRQDWFDRIIAGVKSIDEAKARRRRRCPEIRFDVVILKENYEEIPAIVRLADELGVAGVFFRALQAEGIGADREATIGKDVDFEALYHAVRAGIDEATRRRMRTNLREVARDFQAYRSIYTRRDAALSDQVCLLPWLQCFVSVRGEVSPCCATYTNAGFTAGNAFEQDFAGIWNGPKMRELRRQFKRKENPLAICRDCIPRSVPVLLKMSSMLPGFLRRR